MAHTHSHDSTSNIKTAFFLNLIFTLIEIVGGYLTNSLAIMTDALHDAGDTFALGVSWYLDKVAKRPRTETFSYGFGRFSLLSALISSIVLLFGSLYILSEAVPRLLNPEHSNAPGMIFIAIIGIIVNGVAVLRLQKGKSMNEKVVYWHLLEDVLGWIAVLFTGVVIYVKDIHILDPILSVLIVLYILWNVIKNLKATVRLFLQSVPESINVIDIETQIKAIPNVLKIHDTHVWSLDGDHNILTTHVVVPDSATHEEMVNVKNKVKKVTEKYEIEHSTIEIECENEKCDLNNC